MCYSSSPAGMRCSPSNLVFVPLFESSNELSFEDFPSFKYSNLRSKIFSESFALCSGVYGMVLLMFWGWPTGTWVTRLS